MLSIFLNLKFIHIECSSVNENNLIVESERSNPRVIRNYNFQLEGQNNTQLKDLDFLLENPYDTNSSTDYVEHLNLIYKNFEEYKKLCNFTYNFRANYLATLNFTSTTPLIDNFLLNITSNTSIVNNTFTNFTSTTPLINNTFQQNTLKRKQTNSSLDDKNDQPEKKLSKSESHENEVKSDNTDDISKLNNTTEDFTVTIIDNYNSLQFFNKTYYKYQLYYFLEIFTILYSYLRSVSNKECFFAELSRAEKKRKDINDQFQTEHDKNNLGIDGNIENTNCNKNIKKIDNERDINQNNVKDHLNSIDNHQNSFAAKELYYHDYLTKKQSNLSTCGVINIQNYLINCNLKIENVKPSKYEFNYDNQPKNPNFDAANKPSISTSHLDKKNCSLYKFILDIEEEPIKTFKKPLQSSLDENNSTEDLDGNLSLLNNPEKIDFSSNEAGTKGNAKFYEIKYEGKTYNQIEIPLREIQDLSVFFCFSNLYIPKFSNYIHGILKITAFENVDIEADVKDFLLNKIDFETLVNIANEKFSDGINNTSQNWKIFYDKICDVFESKTVGIDFIFRELVFFRSYVFKKNFDLIVNEKNISLGQIIFFLYIFENILNFDWIDLTNKLKISHNKKIVLYKIKESNLEKYNKQKKEADAKLNLFLYAYTTSYKIIAILVYPFLMKSDYFGFLHIIIGLRLKCKSIYIHKKIESFMKNFLSNNLNFVKNIMFIMPLNILDKNIQKKFKINFMMYEDNGTKDLIGDGRLNFFNVLNFCDQNISLLSDFNAFKKKALKLTCL
ncbi:hypothetical protein GVAV_000839 [Gurleya vavrai]